MPRSTDRSEPSTYEEVAAEYYDEGLHPTCANFREASCLLIGQWLRSLAAEQSALRVCEVGSGRSVLVELLAELGVSASVVLIDESSSMLRHSSATQSVHLVQADASSLPIAASGFDVVAASLGDPYNTSRLWREVARVCRPEGRVWFTTPSFAWAHEFRSEANAELESAEFVTRTGRRVSLPSRIVPMEEQLALARSAGLEPEAYREVTGAELRGPRSSKLDVVGEGPIVVGYSFVRR